MQLQGHITQATVELYRSRQLPPAELVAAQAHAAVCAECRARLAGAVDLDAAFAQVRAEFSGSNSLDDEPAHLAYEQLTAFVDGSLDDVAREIADSHLSVCPDCAADAADLRRYQTINADAQPHATATSNVAATERRKTFWQRLVAFKFSPSFGLFAPAAVAVIIAVLLGLWLVSRTSRESEGDQLARVNPGQTNNGAATQPNAPAITTTQSVSPAQLPALTNKSKTDATQPEYQPSRQRQGTRAGSLMSAPLMSQVALNDGGAQVVFDGRGNLRGLEALAPDARRAVRRSLETQRVTTPRTLDGFGRGTSGVLMSASSVPGAQGGAAFALVEPVGQIVRADRPVLRWQTLAGARSYKVTVVDANFQVVAESEALSATTWTLANALKRGQVYYWQVTATLADGNQVISPRSPAPQAKFRVLAADAAAELKQLDEVAPDSHLARGVLYARAGLVSEAEAEFQELVNRNPRSPVARRLLQSVRRK